jgi:hypothetical protein
MDGANEYLAGDYIYDEDYKVIGDPLKKTVVCGCEQFDRIWILCGYVLKFLI